MVPRSPFKSDNAAASRQKELQKSMCVPGEKRLSLRKLYEFAAREAASKKKGVVVLHVRTTKGPSPGEETFKASTRPKKISTAKVAEGEAVEWFDNSIKPMLNKSPMYSAEVQQALADIVYVVAKHQRVVLNDPEFLRLLKVVAQATPVAPERKCPAIPEAVLQPSAGVADIPPPIETTKHPTGEMGSRFVKAELTASLRRICDDMRSRGETTRPLLDAQGKLVAQLHIRSRQTGTLICLDEAGDGGCPQGEGLVMSATGEQLHVHKVEFSSLEEAMALSQANHWLALAQRFESAIVPITIDRVAVLKEQALALNQAMADLCKAMVEKNCPHLWTDGAHQVWTNEVNRKRFHFSATISTTPDGKHLLTVESHDAYWSEGVKDLWGSALMSENAADGSCAVMSFRLNRKDLNTDKDFLQIGDLDAALHNMKRLLSLVRSFVEDVNRLKAAST
ncbi:MAG: hypothetical protein GTN84_18935 [Hydrogenophaga sp.]|uniref:hypothetical protein n=1 Tax=Hydrogenophaga sp. TaxID=1904254 RepID=UPI0016AC8CD2|nr:hypothetical protein [Hydrogenophaga sp.]NIM43321.1 hypothetical protein [Hydrogenophaga sp.]NIN28390.1 hypothetical protein [Hydrogenophaga sp.]NIN29209.1 hypothetical protein [Hydrogenophaga sp.]NIN57524.1 hypothetical protein [Hydrogenophaga sp.]NIO53819.1 hypothetical protein [Hydrogenophaga sp.]